jgi:RNA polymerase nonessential primary-like sigma factor
MESQARIKIGALLRILSEKEQRIMRLRYGFEHGRNLSLRKISRLVGLSQEGVRRIERKALEKLRRPTIRAKLDSLL